MDKRVTAPAPLQQEERFNSCAITGGSISRGMCSALSRVPSKNTEGCSRKQCLSPWRLCAACVREDSGLAPAVVAKRGARLCAFHEKNGESTLRRQASMPQPFAPKPAVVSKPKPAPVLKPAPAKIEPVMEVSKPIPLQVEIIKEELPQAPKPPALPKVHEAQEPKVKVEPQEVVVPVQVDTVVPDLPRHFDIDLPPRRTVKERDKPVMRYASEDEVKEFAHNIWRVKGRQRVVFETAMEHGVPEASRILNLQPGSIEGYLGTTARVLGIPKPNRFQPYDRHDAMRRTWGYYKEHPEIDNNPLKIVLQRGEIVLIELYRELRPEDRTQLLEIAKIFALKAKKQ